jgi:hypothetical protein
LCAQLCLSLLADDFQHGKLPPEQEGCRRILFTCRPPQLQLFVNCPNDPFGVCILTRKGASPGQTRALEPRHRLPTVASRALHRAGRARPSRLARHEPRTAISSAIHSRTGTMTRRPTPTTCLRTTKTSLGCRASQTCGERAAGNNHQRRRIQAGRTAGIARARQHGGG